MKALLQTLKVLDETVKSQPLLENDFGLWFSLAD
jgi:2-dehydro-3-deoxyphosphooctonate aldolase (KDO 8-P synthase)